MKEGKMEEGGRHKWCRQQAEAKAHFSLSHQYCQVRSSFSSLFIFHFFIFIWNFTFINFIISILGIEGTTGAGHDGGCHASMPCHAMLLSLLKMRREKEEGE